MRRWLRRLWPRSQTRRAILVAALIFVVLAGLFVTAVEVLVDDWSDMTKIKDVAGAFQSAVTIVAIVLGGTFAWLKLQAFREFEPHLTITHEVHHRQISDSYIHIDVTATLYNSSRVSVELREAVLIVQQVSRLDDEAVEELYNQVFVEERERDVQWDTLEDVNRTWDEGYLIIEPGESHRENYDFIVSDVVGSVQVLTYFYNSTFSAGAGVAEGWEATTVYDIL